MKNISKEQFYRINIPNSSRKRFCRDIREFRKYTRVGEKENRWLCRQTSYRRANFLRGQDRVVYVGVSYMDRGPAIVLPNRSNRVRVNER